MSALYVPEADEELSEATAYLNQRSEQAAQRFLGDVDRAVQLGGEDTGGNAFQSDPTRNPGRHHLP